MRIPRISIFGIGALLIFSFFVFAYSRPEVTRGDSITDLQSVIDKKQAQIKKLEDEINQYEQQLDSAGKQSKTLQNSIAELDLQRKKLLADLTVTESKINFTGLEIEKLDAEIKTKEQNIADDKNAISESLRQMNETESKPMLVTMLEYDNLSNFFDELASLEQFQKSVAVSINELETLKKETEQKRLQTKGKQSELASLRSELGDRKKIVDDNKQDKAQLLAATKNKEALYKKTLNEKKILQKEFEKELFDFESQLKFAIDLSKIPDRKPGVLAYPLDSVHLTQEFGDTSFTRSRPGVYAGKGHNGIDLAASIGTKVKAADVGVVQGTGDTDIVCPRASWGRWVLIQHPNGLSTLYAHLSVIKVTAGQTVSRGELIAYSGNTGYSTGPHVHFTVYATDGVKILSRKSATCGGTYTMPIADFRAYLNPLLFL